MNIYNNLHIIDANSNYGYDKDQFTKKNCELAEYIHNNYDKMSDDELKFIVTKCMTDKKIRRELLEFELRYYKDTPRDMELNEFSYTVTKILNRYQSRAGGFQIEDRDWTLYTYLDNENTDHVIKPYEILFENSIDKYDFEDNETYIYMKRLVKRLKTISTNIKIKYRYRYKKKDGVVWLLLWCRDKDMKLNMGEPKITL